MTKLYDENNLKNLLVNTEKEELQQYLADIHPADILEVLRDEEIDKSVIMKKLPTWMVANLFEEMDDEEKEEFLNLFSNLEQYKIVNEMSSDEITDLLYNLEPERINEFLTNIDKEDAEEVKALLTYDEETAGGLMATEFISIKESMTVKDALKYLQTAGINAETAYYLYVLDDTGILKGIVSLRELVIATFKTKISDIMHENVKSIPTDMDQDEVAYLFEKYGFQAMPVIDTNGEMQGVVTVDDIFEVIREEATEDILRLAGVNEGEVIDGKTVD